MHQLRVALCLCFLYVASVTSAVVHLTDSNFESATQASTGQTTGHWSVSFLADVLKQGWQIYAGQITMLLTGLSFLPVQH